MPAPRARSLLAAAAVAAAAAAVVVAAPMSASAATVDTSASYVVVSRHSGKALDVYDWSTADNAPVVQWTRNDLAVQQWQFVDAGSGYYKVRSRHSGKVLELPSAADGTPLVQNADNGSNRQHFRLADSSGGTVRLINRHSNKALDVWEWSTADGATIAGFTDLDGANQQWQLVRLSGGGTPTTPPPGNGSWPTPTGSVRVDGTTSVSGTFDGGLRRYYGIGDGGQSESQDPMFRLAAGATLRNVIIGAPAGDGVHCDGNCTLINVWWEDVGEDAATFRGGSAYTVDGGGARSASDKVFQHNGGGTVTIRNFVVQNAGKLYRACGNCSTSYQRHVVLQNITATSTKMLAGINSNFGDTARLSNITIVGDGSRSTKICTRFRGVGSGDEPEEIGSGPDSTHCLYRDSDITWR